MSLYGILKENQYELLHFLSFQLVNQLSINFNFKSSLLKVGAFFSKPNYIHICFHNQVVNLKNQVLMAIIKLYVLLKDIET
jgi:hypothetical protein